MRSIALFSAPSLLAATPLAAALLFGSSTALASGGYPGNIATKLSVDAPACTLCHDTDAGGSGTANKPFALTMRNQYGLTGGSATAALEAALDNNTADSDGDGASDIDELRNGEDPNRSGGSVTPAKYGCIEQNSSIAGSTSAPPRIASMVMAGLVAGVLLLRRRR